MKLTVATEVTGVTLDWYGYRVACEACGADTGLTLRSGTYSQWDAGETAVAVCSRCEEEFQHPLVTPQVVDDASRGQVRESWRPHLRHEEDYDLEGLANLKYMVEYLPWEKTGHLGPGWWEQRHPGLVAASLNGPDWLKYQYVPYSIRVERGTPPHFLTDLPKPPGFRLDLLAPGAVHVWHRHPEYWTLRYGPDGEIAGVSLLPGEAAGQDRADAPRTARVMRELYRHSGPRRVPVRCPECGTDTGLLFAKANGDPAVHAWCGRHGWTTDLDEADYEELLAAVFGQAAP